MVWCHVNRTIILAFLGIILLYPSGVQANGPSTANPLYGDEPLHYHDPVDELRDVCDPVFNGFPVPNLECLCPFPEDTPDPFEICEAA